MPSQHPGGHFRIAVSVSNTRSKSPLPSPGAARLEKRRRFRQLETRSSASGWTADERSNGALLESGMFNCLEDECIIEVMHALVEVVGVGLYLQKSVLNGAANLGALLCACKRMNTVFCAIATDLRLEMLARAATQIVPKNLHQTTYPFTEQLRLETRSSDQIKLLREAITGLATHCAGPCCAASRRGVNRDIRESGKRTAKPRNAMITPATEHANVVAASADGERAFVSLRKLISKRSEHGPGRANQYAARRHEEWLVCVGHRSAAKGKQKARVECYQQKAICLDDTDSRTWPHSMRSSANGNAVTMVRGMLSASSLDAVPHSCVQLWLPDRNSNKLPSPEPPGELELAGAINAQDAWFLDGEEDTRLVVLWSTGYVHPCGSVVGSNADSACYGIAVYDLSGDNLELDTFSGPWPGKVQTASPTATGDEVLLVVRMPTVGIGPSAHATRASFLHQVRSEDRFALDHSSVMGGASGHPRHPLDIMNSPSAAGLSPTGDCAVAVHHSRGLVIVEVLLRTGDSTFVSVQSMDVTHYTTIINGEQSVFNSPGTNAQTVAATLKLPYGIVFSPCSRFATIVDQRPLNGLTLTNHALVVLDLALLHERRGVRALPLASVNDVAPRSMVWTDQGIWLQARHGALLLWSP